MVESGILIIMCGSLEPEDVLYLMNDMIVLCDEAHNLLRNDGTATDGLKQDIDRCKRRLFAATGSVAVFFTATPVTKGATAMAEAKNILRLVKGAVNANKGDEGFVS